MNTSKKKFIAGAAAALFIIPMAVAFGQSSNSYYEQHVMKPVHNDQGEVIGTTRQADDIKKLNLPEDTYVIDKQAADINGDQIKDTIYLVGHKQNADALFADNLKVVVYDGVINSEINTDLKLAGYEGSLFIGDFNGDQINDIFVKAPTGGSGGIVEHRIVTFKNNQGNVIFNHDDNLGAKFSGTFVNGFKAEIINENTQKSITVDLSGKKEIYLGNYYDTDGNLLKEVKPISYPFGSLEPVDIDRDGVYELRGIQRMIGAYGADAIGNVYSYWKYENNSWNLRHLEVSSIVLPFTLKK